MEPSESENRRRRIRSYVLRQGKLGISAERALTEYGPTYCIPFSNEPLDFPALFPGMGKTVMEIGFGMGEGTAEIARNNPETGYVGIEVYTPGVCRLLGKIAGNDLRNIRIIQYDAVPVVEGMIRDESLDGIHVFFPDPWPKKRHHKRRLLSTGFLTLLSDKLKPGGYFYFVTDWEEYAKEVLDSCRSIPSFRTPPGGFSGAVKWRPVTSFEKKGIEQGRVIHEIFIKKCVKSESKKAK